MCDSSGSMRSAGTLNGRVPKYAAAAMAVFKLVSTMPLVWLGAHIRRSIMATRKRTSAWTAVTSCSSMKCKADSMMRPDDCKAYSTSVNDQLTSLTAPRSNEGLPVIDDQPEFSRTLERTKARMRNREWAPTLVKSHSGDADRHWRMAVMYFIDSDCVFERDRCAQPAAVGSDHNWDGPGRPWPISKCESRRGRDSK